MLVGMLAPDYLTLAAWVDHRDARLVTREANRLLKAGKPDGHDVLSVAVSSSRPEREMKHGDLEVRVLPH